MHTYSYVAALLPLATLLATPVSGEDFNYDPNSEAGPDNWGSLAIADNQCGGDSNSPIDLYSRPCDVFADYEFTVRPCFSPRYKPSCCVLSLTQSSGPNTTTIAWYLHV